jgi:hypothetical protein
VFERVIEACMTAGFVDGQLGVRPPGAK